MLIRRSEFVIFLKFCCVNMAHHYRKYDYLLKILLVGNSGVGKTSMASRATNDTFETEVASTLGIDFRTKFVDVLGKTVKLQLWDTSGQERYLAVTTSFYRGANGALLVYDITDEKSLQDVTSWLNSVRDYTSSDIEVIIIGNKCDKENKRKVSEEEGRALAEKNHCLFFETSAQSNTNIQLAFKALAEKIVNAHLEGKIFLGSPNTIWTESPDVGLNLDYENQNRNTDKECCR